MKMTFYRKRLLSRRKRKTMSLRKNRKINPELIHAARVAKLIRTIGCAGPIIMQRDRSRFRQIAKFILQQVIKSDKQNPPGKRNVLKGNMRLLEGYDLETDVPLLEIIRAPFTSTVDANNGDMHIYFPSFIPSKQLIYPDNATHCKIIAVGASMDLNYYNATMESDTSSLIPLVNEAVPAFTLNVHIPPNHGQTMLLLMGISYINTPTSSGNVVPLCQAAKILQVERTPERLKFIKGNKMLIMNFDEKNPF
ncbi:hypothetical protein SIO70_00795 [Chitinophaga sancti]|uniref:hypothetical protein n=1 Tax=Chitinophaga sancti TaxID=1004 RepID=UPI002A7592BB|nr:hypothetical protein [Chitinophaga sancti]WPQ63399.1 hypothetical protein SIO70_00795 [Chitinophaga sancti]